MRSLGPIFRKLTALFSRRQLESDVDAELAFHLEMRRQEEIRRGSDPQQAALASRRRFGSVFSVTEQSKEAWLFVWTESVQQDIRFALRGLRRASGFSAVAILTLGLGIGGSTAIFSVVNATLLRPLPYRDADRLVRIVENVPAAESPSGVPHRTTAMNEDAYLWWRDQAKTLASMDAVLASPMTAQVGGETLRLAGARVSATLFTALGTSPAIGRLLTPVDEHSNVAILSTAAWRRLFAGDPQIVGRTIVLDRIAHTIVGVAPSNFAFPSTQTEIWTPNVVQPVPNRVVAVDVLARLRDGVSLEAASTEIGVLGQRWIGEPSPDETTGPRSRPRFEVVGLQDQLVEPIRPSLQILMGAVILVLLNVCANIANLFLARSVDRRRELDIRRALGAGRGRVVRQLFTEGIVVSLIAGVAGIGLAVGAISLVKALAPINMPALYGGSRTLMPGMEHVVIDSPVLMFTVVASIATGLLFGLFPAIHVSRVWAGATRGQVSGSGVTQTAAGIRRGLTIAQLGLATMLLVGGGLLIRSFFNLSNVDLGYSPETAFTFELVLPEHLPEARKLALANELTSRLSSLPQVLAAGFTSAAPLSTLNGGWALTPPSVAPTGLLGRPGLRVGASSVSPDYLRAIGVRLLEGRWLDADHGLNEPPAVLVNRALARQFFADQTPLGRTVNIGGRVWHVVGVVEDLRSKGLDLDPEPRAYLDHDRFVADAHDAGWDKLAAVPAPKFLSFALRVDPSPFDLVGEVRSIVSQLEPLAAVDGAVAMTDVVAGTLVRPRFYAVLIGLFAAIAMAIAAVGVYGVLSYTVTQRTHEIGIRIALGATPREVMRMVARDAGMMSGIGIAVGVAGAAALTRSLQSLLFGVSPFDATTFLLVPVLCGVAAALASFGPAHRATRVDPVVALRCE